MVKDRNPDGRYEPSVLAEMLKSLERHSLIKAFREHTRDAVPLPVKIWLMPEYAPLAPVPMVMPRWHADLAWISSYWPRATAKQRAGYTAINTWLKSEPDLFPVPLRERALEILGTFASDEDFPVPEKAFDDLTSGPLFGDRHVLDALIRAFRPPLPLLTESFPRKDEQGYFRRVGSGDLLLVIENATTWWSLVESLPERHRLGYVAWGLGASFRASVLAIAKHHRVAEIRYFGDLDLSGLRIPLAADAKATAAGLPPVRPAKSLYDSLFRLGRPRVSKEAPATLTEAATLTDWLPSPHRSAAYALLTAGHRLAQEWVGYRHLIRNVAWHRDIT
ncbi:Wadjet anti-phage system protein JetD domain-containing protein [Streptosporangium algeriense]|uniref:Wadjet anti-phage system protein JetD domain-containing protein n=1 Tax=Streptosporangium algeriense TaxID=1682748 RepID=A0ABW3DGH7_9ACTN